MRIANKCRLWYDGMRILCGTIEANAKYTSGNKQSFHDYWNNWMGIKISK
jgi:hypothetical protein